MTFVGDPFHINSVSPSMPAYATHDDDAATVVGAVRDSLLHAYFIDHQFGSCLVSCTAGRTTA